MNTICRTLFVWMALVAGLTVALDQSGIDYIANSLDVTYTIMNNFRRSGRTQLHEVEIGLRNNGNEALTADGPWTLYFFSISMCQPQELLASDRASVNKAGAPLGTSGLRLYHENGYLFKIVPTSDFQGLEPGQELVLPMNVSHWQVARTDVMPNWYVTGGTGTVPRTITSTTSEDLGFVGDLTTKEQWKRVPWDTYNPYTAEDRYELYKAIDLGRAPLRILPSVRKQELNTDKGLNVKTGDWVVTYRGDAEKLAMYLAENIGIQHVADVSTQPSRYISLNIDEELPIVDCTERNESYAIKIDHSPEKIEITGVTTAGVFYGIQTLLSLATREGGIPSGTIEDCPRFGYRGMHVDVARNFFRKETIQRLLDNMAIYKLNVLHLHLSDDEGWRLEIPGLQELTMVGAHRCHDPTGDLCLMPQLGSGPSSGTSGSGFYTVQDYQDILEYANDRHIQVLPELDMPGHAHAAVNAMLARYRRLRDIDEEEAKKYLLTDFDDTSEYLSIQMFTDNALSPCIPSTYTFIEHIMEELVKMHKDIQPLKRFHFGGDEVPHTAWLNSSACSTVISSGDKGDIKKHFVAEVSKLAKRHGLGLQAWEDGLMYHGRENEPFDKTGLATDDIRANTWNNIWEWGSGSRSHILANAGYKTIISFATNMYFDHPSEPDPEERGYYWASRIIDVDRTFRLMPDSIYDNMEVSLMGVPLDKDKVCRDHPCPPLERRENIIGLQGQLWTETVRTEDQFHEMIFPRVLALAERAWHKAPWENILDDKDKRNEERQKDWEEFLNLVGYQELRRLDDLDIKYHVRPPGAKVSGTDVRVRTEFPGLPVRISTDGATWFDVKGNITVREGTKLTLVAGSPDYRRTSRASLVNVQEKPTSSAPYTKHSTVVLLVAFLLTWNYSIRKWARNMSLWS